MSSKLTELTEYSPSVTPLSVLCGSGIFSCSSRTRDDQLPLPFPPAQVIQQREHSPIWLNREDPNMENDGQDSVARLFRRVDRNSMEVISHSNDRMIPGTASEDMAAKFAWYVEELINNLQRAFDDLVRDY
ncbi:hypothetical protein O181_029236 [Austropuccinia psidii MF-1]|uniref:Uncharacterized protein n=1 Tax=Austropuccinia psidii MF-1 TaxID=1389203 RepID=A0A9Q3H346_9BASI|nr:hypothetical protein [Austropuccinia psidii MF-1]